MTAIVTQPKPAISKFLIDRFMSLDILPDPTFRDMAIRVRIIDGVLHVRMVTNEFPKEDFPHVIEQVRLLLNKEASNG